MIKIFFAIAIFLVFYLNVSYAAGVPQTLNYQGVLQSSNGQPVNGPQNIKFSLYTTPMGPEIPFLSETLTNIPVSNGQLSVTLGTIAVIDASKFNGETYLGITVGAQPEMLPRQKMTSVPYALNAYNGVPKGGIIMWSGTVVPGGWALCDGSNGTPDLREKFIIGTSTTYRLGRTGGEAAHVLTETEMPSHSHAQNPHNHGGVTGSASLMNTGAYALSLGTGYYQLKNDYVAHSHTIPFDTATNQASGGNTAHNNLPPYYALAFIIKL